MKRKEMIAKRQAIQFMAEMTWKYTKAIHSSDSWKFKTWAPCKSRSAGKKTEKKNQERRT